jgi:hypothetical protein
MFGQRVGNLTREMKSKKGMGRLIDALLLTIGRFCRDWRREEGRRRKEEYGEMEMDEEGEGANLECVLCT